MALLIDGYNLLHVTGIFGPGRGSGPAAGSLERSRTALLNVLAASIPADELRQATIVFDAHDAPPGLPRRLSHRGLTVCYASEYESADAMLEELIARHHAPRQLLVVSSDHRVQRAARRRRAEPIDSDVWYTDLIRKRAASRDTAVDDQSARPAVPLSPSEIEYWLEKFADSPSDTVDEQTSLDNPFPPGYGEDLLEE